MASSFVPNTKCALGFYDHEARLGLTEYYKKQQAALYLKSSTITSGLIKNSHFGESYITPILNTLKKMLENQIDDPICL